MSDGSESMLILIQISVLHSLDHPETILESLMVRYHIEIQVTVVTLGPWNSGIELMLSSLWLVVYHERVPCPRTHGQDDACINYKGQL